MDTVARGCESGIDSVFGDDVSGEANQSMLKVQKEEGAVVVAAAGVKKKKKKKKMDAGKENNMLHVSAVEEKVGSVKKVPKHVKEIQERLSKLREAEERRKREYEEKLMKEEEERLKQEELERLAQEKKRLKKEREKEKLLKKRKEGKLLTAKQKEEARRLESMRKHILANANLDSSTAAAAVGKRIRYQNKVSKPIDQSVEAAISDLKEIQQDVESELELDSVERVESSSSHEEVIDALDDDQEWDAKNWDCVDLKLQDFANEESVDVPKKSEPEKNDKNKNKNVYEKNQKVVDVEQDSSKPDDGQSLRSPICCVMGHVDAGKTKLLDCIRGSNVQEGEAGGITQQIGATYIPAENIHERTKGLKADAKINVPGLLVIDTPGHEAFNKLRSIGSRLCDIAVLVVDIMDGLAPQTIESINLLKENKTDFIVALNKVDRLYGWRTCRDEPICKAIRQQSKDVMNEFKMRLTQVITQFKEQGINTELYYKNKERGDTYNIVPTSATSGEGIPDLLLLLVQWAQRTMVKRLTFNEHVQCFVLEVKVVEGHGTTIDVVLVNGVLHEGDQIVVPGRQGLIVTTIRALLTPHPMRDLRVKGTYVHHRDIKAAQGIKIAAQGLEHTIEGTNLYVVGPHDDIEATKEAAMEDLNSVISRTGTSSVGVYVQASTLGSLEALLEFLKTPAVNIPVRATRIGPVHKKDVKIASVMLEKRKEYATILAFDVKVTPGARELADKRGVKIFTADIIYHLFNQFTEYMANDKEEKKREAAKEAIFPCKLEIKYAFRRKDPILLEVDVVDGIAKVGTPLCSVQEGCILDIGKIESIEYNHRPFDCAKRGQQVAIKIVGSNPEEQQKMFGRHFQTTDQLVSKISRRSLDALEQHYKDDLSTDEMGKLLVELKKKFKIT
ncbi:uncharacterized protein LOC131006280 [Salvia miltiorrhiza]|uniref:uncharacterized protein LOC131006280 n=1 Tax=Salvia miltiorrhiza TaxID=226208 RepID=UPI0025ACA5F0|nr:uncharacterized protein LOC131006280 [Salvia miltiorrhiza]